MVLKAYMTHEGKPDQGCTLVFANSPSEAKKTALTTGWYEEYINIRAIRKPKFDQYAGNKSEPWYVETNDELPFGVTFFAEPDSGYDTLS